MRPGTWGPAKAAGQHGERYPVPRWQLDDARLRPILERLRELDAQAHTVELIGITAWQGEAMLGTRLSTVHTALAVVTAAPLSATHLGLEGCGDFCTGDTWLDGRGRRLTAAEHDAGSAERVLEARQGVVDAEGLLHRRREPGVVAAAVVVRLRPLGRHRVVDGFGPAVEGLGQDMPTDVRSPAHTTVDVRPDTPPPAPVPAVRRSATTVVNLIDMALFGYVSCRCWQDGSTTPPPVPAEWIRFRDGGVRLSLPFPQWLKTYRMVDEWMATACRHPNMEHVERRVCNWPRYRLLQTALAAAGWEHFPTLRAELPEYGNLGTMPATSAAQVLTELTYFTEQAALGGRLVLVDERSGSEICEYVPAYDGVARRRRVPARRRPRWLLC